MKADKRGVNVVWQTCRRHIGPVTALCIETNGERIDGSTLDVSLIRAVWLDTIFVYIQTWTKQRWTDRGCMTTVFWTAFGVFPQRWRHNASLLPVSQRRSPCSLITVDSRSLARDGARAVTYLQLLRELFEVFVEAGNDGILETRGSLSITGCQPSPVDTQITLLLFGPRWIFLLSSSMFSGVLSRGKLM